MSHKKQTIHTGSDSAGTVEAINLSYMLLDTLNLYSGTEIERGASKQICCHQTDNER